VHRGLLALKGKFYLHDESIVLIHDAARCCLTPQLVSRVIEGVLQHGAVTAAVPIFDALSRAEDGRVTNYVDRQDLWSIQTPQGFLLSDLLRAHEQAQHSGDVALDDATLVARLRPVHIVMGDRLNIKVTNPHDLEVTEVICAGRR
jgi:2-C-methyl-D-erythritol 4-phosphate cytidylyltransferase